MITLCDIMEHMKLIYDSKQGGYRRKVMVECERCGKQYMVGRETFLYHQKHDKPCRFCAGKVHGESMERSQEYNTWTCMRDRCRNKRYKNYANYGGRGIKVCDRWNANDGSGFAAFLEDMGRKPGKEYTLDRIDPDGDYCPENCRWASPKEQAMNKKSTTVVEWNGEKDSITGWAKRLDMVVPAVKYNYEHGLPLDTRRHARKGKLYNGKTITEWAKELDVKYSALRLFMKNHDYDIEEAIKYYTSDNRRKYPWANRPSEVGATRAL